MQPKHIHGFFIDQKFSPWALAYLFFFCLLSMGQLQRIELGNFPAFYLHDLVLTSFVALHLIDGKWRSFCWKLGKSIPTVGWVGLGWVGAGLVLAAFSTALPLYTFLFYSRLALFTLSIISALYDLQTKKISPANLITGMLFFFFFIFYFGVLQYLFFPDTRFLFFLGWDDHYYRLVSTLLDPNFTGLLLCLAYLFTQFLLSMATRYKFHLSERKVLSGLSILFSVGILFTYSRASYLAFLFSIGAVIFFYWQKKQHRQFWMQLIVALLFIFLIPFLPRPGGEGVKLERTSTVVGRLNTAQQQLQLLKSPAQFILGKGLFVPVAESTATPYSNQSTHARLADNWVIMFFTGTGVVGLGIFCYVLIQIFKSVLSRSLFLAIGMGALLIHGLFNASIVYPFIILVLGSWIVVTLES